MNDILDKLRDPLVQMYAALIFATICAACWPLSLLVTSEPPLILSLSWLALIIPALNTALTAGVKNDAEQ